MHSHGASLLVEREVRQLHLPARAFAVLTAVGIPAALHGRPGLLLGEGLEPSEEPRPPDFLLAVAVERESRRQNGRDLLVRRIPKK